MKKFIKILKRTAPIEVILSEFLSNLIFTWILYGLFCWESNPLRWSIDMKITALVFLCIWLPFMDSKKAIEKEEKEQSKKEKAK
jgi:hypothetical protein